jgi:fucose permease
MIVVGVFLTGLSLSGLFPTGLAFGSRLYPEQTGTVTATLNLAMTAGATLPPWWTGLIADQWGFQTALAVNFVMVVPLVWISLYLRKVERRNNE